MTQPLNTFYVIKNTKEDLYYSKRSKLASVGGENMGWAQSNEPCASLMQATKFRQKRTAHVHLKAMKEDGTQTEITDHLIVLPVTGNSDDYRCEFTTKTDKERKNLPVFSNPKREIHCQKCGLLIPAFVPYFGSNYKTTICIICMHGLTEEVERRYEEYRAKHPKHLDNYEHAKFAHDL